MLAFWSVFFAPVLAGITALVGAFWLARSTHWRLLDHPNARSLHERPIPRTGGFAVLSGLAVGSVGLALFVAELPPLLKILPFGLLPLAAISWLDDRHGVAAWQRLAVHGVAAGSLIIAGLSIPGLELLPVWATMSLTGLFVVWMINLYNFMDGMDGFAGGMAVIGFTTLAWLGRADIGFVAISLIIAAASAGFLVSNFPPARLFLGDTGSTTLGFLAAALSLWGSQADLFPLWAALWVFSPFIVDATVTLLRRLAQGERVWEGHRSHYYQRLVLLGWGHRCTVLAEYVLMLTSAGSAVLAVQWWPDRLFVLVLGGGGVYGLLMWGVAWLEQRPLDQQAKD
ncbi:MAG: hypothetical protein QG599_392 [Pseudomonadota bacterium]|nr:hypothetical protein [Pseudomonadota bacterium]